MTIAFKYTGAKSSNSEGETIILHSEENCDIIRVLHKVGVRLGLAQEVRDTSRGITTNHIFGIATPEMFAEYGVTMIRTSDSLTPAEPPRLIVHRYELETYREIEEKYDLKYYRTVNTAEQIARRLETKWKHGHPVVSTWSYRLLLLRAISWARDKVDAEDIKGAADMGQFFEQKLREAKPAESAQ